MITKEYIYTATNNHYTYIHPKLSSLSVPYSIGCPNKHGNQETT